MEKETKHTPEWRWILNESSKTVRLESTASGRDTIMDFVRYGMTWAQPRFNVDGIMIKAEELGEVVEGREHHAEWFKFINHPTAQLIASAPSLQSEIDRLKGELSEMKKEREELAELLRFAKYFIPEGTGDESDYYDNCKSRIKSALARI